VREIVVGTGGRTLHPLAAFPNRQAADDATWGVLRLGLHPTSYDWTFLPASSGGFTDSGSSDCH
jgi:hypothetical protein